MAKTKKLSKYRKMRSADRTPEPFGGAVGSSASRFVVQLHAARRLHYDFRLEIENVLRSWAVPKGPSPNPKDKRLAVRTEDHPIEYANFEGQIPKDNYGAGTVLLWDRGYWVPLEDPIEGERRGKLLFSLHGYKLKGIWTLVKLKKTQKEWLLIKERDGYAENADLSFYPSQSVLSGLSFDNFNDSSQREKKILGRLKKARCKETKEAPKYIAPMLATPHQKAFTKNGWLFELKYDGYRMIISKEGPQSTLYTRNGNDISELFPELKESIDAIPFESFVLDGELVVHDDEGRPSFQRLQKRIKLKSKREITLASIRQPASFYAFDLLQFQQYDVRTLRLAQRKDILAPMIHDVGPLRLSPSFEKEGEALLEQTHKLKLEGIVAKKIEARYISGRSPSWLKIRADKSDDFVILGYSLPKRSRAGFGALLVGIYRSRKWQYAGRVGTGFSDNELSGIRSLLETIKTQKAPCEIPEDAKDVVWVRPKVVVEVRYKQWIEVLRQAAFIRLRDDKTAKECKGQREVSTSVAPATNSKLPATRNRVKKEVKFSNLDKIFWSTEKITKGDLINYYRTVSPWLLKYLKDRPVILTRYPDGIEGKSFFQKDAPVFTPPWLRTESVWSEHGEREIRYFICDDEESLLYLINLGTIPLHIWASRISKPEKPDWCVIDLDPKSAPFKDVITIAKYVHRLCNEIGMPSFVKTTGSTGLHILLPLNQKLTHEQSRTLGELIAKITAAKLKDIATTIRSPSKRGGKVYVDYLQNGYGKLMAAPYCVRPLPGAPISIPLRWEEVNQKLRIEKHTIHTAIKRIKKWKEDPLLGVMKARPKILNILKKLAKLAEAI